MKVQLLAEALAYCEPISPKLAIKLSQRLGVTLDDFVDVLVAEIEKRKREQ